MESLPEINSEDESDEHQFRSDVAYGASKQIGTHPYPSRQTVGELPKTQRDNVAPLYEENLKRLNMASPLRTSAERSFDKVSGSGLNKSLSRYSLTNSNAARSMLSFNSESNLINHKKRVSEVMDNPYPDMKHFEGYYQD